MRKHWRPVALAIALVLGNVAIAYDLWPKAATADESPRPVTAQGGGVIQFDRDEL